MVDMTPPTVMRDNSRLKEARERYQASIMASENKNDKSGIEPALLKFLQNQVPIRSPREQKVAANKDGGIPVPLPVKPIDPEALMTQIKTNMMLKQLSDTIVKTSLPQPVKIDDSRIATESTLGVVSYLLSEIHKSVLKLIEDMLKNIKGLNGSIRQGFFKSIESGEEERGWATKFISKYVDKIRGMSPKIDTFMERLIRYTKPIADFSKRQSDQLAALIRIQLAQLESKTSEARKTLIKKGLIKDSDDPKKPTSALKGLVNAVVPEKGVLRSALNVIGTIGSFFGYIGKVGASLLKSKLGVSIGLIYQKMPIVARVLGLFGGIGGFIGMIAGSAVFAAVYAAFKNPDQILGYFGAFGRLFSENIIPTLQWISSEIVPILSVAFAGLMVAVEYLADKVGTLINESLIYILGTALPNIFTLIGKTISSLWDGMKEVALRIAGLFGIGSHAEDGFFKNIFGIFTAIGSAWVGVGDALMDYINKWLTGIVNTLGLSDFFGMKDGESLFGRIERFLKVDIPNFVVGMFDSLVSTITDLMNKFDPTGAIRQKFMDLVTAIGSIFPSWQDIKNFIISGLESAPLPQNVRRWMVNKIKGDPSPGPETFGPEFTAPNRSSIIQWKARLNNTKGVAEAEALVQEAKRYGVDLTEAAKSMYNKYSPEIEALKNKTMELGDKLGEATTGAINTYIFAPQSSTTNNSSSVSNNMSRRGPLQSYWHQNMSMPLDGYLNKMTPY